jgi:hypothetical protein
MIRILQIIGFAILGLGVLGWFAGFSISLLDIPRIGPTYEMPLGDLSGIAVDSSGNIYCGAQFYSRIQKYDSEGRFLFGLRIDASGGGFRFRVNKNDELEVGTSRTDLVYRFSPSGELLERKNDIKHRFFDELGSEGEIQCYEPYNILYKIPTSTLFPSVVRITPSGQTRTVVSVPFQKWLLMGPLPAILYWFAGMILLAIAYHLEKKRKSNPKNTSCDLQKLRML